MGGYARLPWVPFVALLCTWTKNCSSVLRLPAICVVKALCAMQGFYVACPVLGRFRQQQSMVGCVRETLQSLLGGLCWAVELTWLVVFVGGPVSLAGTFYVWERSVAVA